MCTSYKSFKNDFRYLVNNSINYPREKVEAKVEAKALVNDIKTSYKRVLTNLNFY